MPTTTGSVLAGSAYLPSKLKKTLKLKQQVNQIKSITRKLTKIKEKQEQIRQNSFLETSFNREMSSWRKVRERVLE